MVQRVFLNFWLKFGVAIGLLIFACVSTEDESGRRVIGGATPVLVSSEPSEAGPGATVEVVGSGFSIVPAENIVSFGGASAIASEYVIDPDGNQTLLVEVPAEAPEGNQPLFVIVRGTPSNSLDFTVNP